MCNINTKCRVEAHMRLCGETLNQSSPFEIWKYRPSKSGSKRIGTFLDDHHGLATSAVRGVQGHAQPDECLAKCAS